MESSNSLMEALPPLLRLPQELHDNIALRLRESTAEDLAFSILPWHRPTGDGNLNDSLRNLRLTCGHLNQAYAEANLSHVSMTGDPTTFVARVQSFTDYTSIHHLVRSLSFSNSPERACVLGPILAAVKAVLDARKGKPLALEINAEWFPRCCLRSMEGSQLESIFEQSRRFENPCGSWPGEPLRLTSLTIHYPVKRPSFPLGLIEHCSKDTLRRLTLIEISSSPSGGINVPEVEEEVKSRQQNKMAGLVEIGKRHPQLESLVFRGANWPRLSMKRLGLAFPKLERLGLLGKFTATRQRPGSSPCLPNLRFLELELIHRSRGRRRLFRPLIILKGTGKALNFPADDTKPKGTSELQDYGFPPLCELERITMTDCYWKCGVRRTCILYPKKSSGGGIGRHIPTLPPGEEEGPTTKVSFHSYYYCQPGCCPYLCADVHPHHALFSRADLFKTPLHVLKEHHSKPIVDERISDMVVEPAQGVEKTKTCGGNITITNPGEQIRDIGGNWAEEWGQNEEEFLDWDRKRHIEMAREAHDERQRGKCENVRRERREEKEGWKREKREKKAKIKEEEEEKKKKKKKGYWRGKIKEWEGKLKIEAEFWDQQRMRLRREQGEERERSRKKEDGERERRKADKVSRKDKRAERVRNFFLPGENEGNGIFGKNFYYGW